MAIHIVGAGVAGLTSAVTAALAGEQVIVYEAAGHAGGRCRTFVDSTLERAVDNGIHMLIGANASAFRYIDMIGSRNEWQAVAPAAFPFLDASTGESWCLRPNAGRVPWWLLVPGRRVGGSRFADYLGVARLARARPGDTVADCLDGPLMERLWRPLTEAALNTAPAEASALLFRQVVRESFLSGEAACRPHLTRNGLTPALVDPALERLRRAGGVLHLKTRLLAIESGAGGTTLRFDTASVVAGPRDRVVLALPPWAIAALVPGVAVPGAFRSIVNIHYRLERPVALPGDAPFLGIIAEPQVWVFPRGDVLSATISAAEALLPRPAEEIAAHVWAIIATSLRLPEAPLPPFRVIKEKRATPAHVPVSQGQTNILQQAGVVLAGDWTVGEIPATIEAATRSGFRAAELVLAKPGA